MNRSRHSGLFSLSHTYATLIGAGGIGAITAVTLAKMGIAYLEIWDDDTVDDVNLPTQLHRLSDIGRAKVDAVHDLVLDMSDDTDVSTFFARVDEKVELQNQIVISAVDSITARKAIWEAVKRGKVAWYIDARMSSEVFQIFTVDMAHPEFYEQLLAGVNEADISEEPCTSKATFFCADLAAGHVGAAVRRIVTGNQKPGLLVHDIFNQALTVIEQQI